MKEDISGSCAAVDVESNSDNSNQESSSSSSSNNIYNNRKILFSILASVVVVVVGCALVIAGSSSSVKNIFSSAGGGEGGVAQLWNDESVIRVSVRDLDSSSKQRLQNLVVFPSDSNKARGVNIDDNGKGFKIWFDLEVLQDNYYRCATGFQADPQENWDEAPCATVRINDHGVVCVCTSEMNNNIGAAAVRAKTQADSATIMSQKERNQGVLLRDVCMVRDVCGVCNGTTIDTSLCYAPPAPSVGSADGGGGGGDPYKGPGTAIACIISIGIVGMFALAILHNWRNQQLEKF